MCSFYKLDVTLKMAYRSFHLVEGAVFTKLQLIPSKRIMEEKGNEISLI